MRPLLTQCPYDAKLGAHRPPILAKVLTFYTKKQASEFAKAIGWKVASVSKLANRFTRSWGLRHHPLSDMFLSNPLYSDAHYTRYGTPPTATVKDVRDFIDKHMSNLSLNNMGN